MRKEFNETFRHLLAEYSLPDDLSFAVDLPPEVQELVNDQIVITELGVTLESLNGLYQASQEWENQSVIEDSENHFHVDWYIDPPDNKKAFMLAVRTLTALAEKFHKEKIHGVRFWLSFQTPELGKLWAKEKKVHHEDEYYISDRLSFYTRRRGEEVVTIDNNDKSYWAILIIDT